MIALLRSSSFSLATKEMPMSGRTTEVECAWLKMLRDGLQAEKDVTRGRYSVHCLVEVES